jgi:opacity protein-like surface antigen
MSRGPLPVLGLVAVLLLAAPGAVRAGLPYVGAGIGAARETFDEAMSGVHATDFTASATAWRLFAGYLLIPYVAVEGGYVALGRDHFGDQGGHQFEARVSGFDLAAAGVLPVAGRFAAIARAGVVFWRSEAIASGQEAARESGNDLVLALGVRYDLVPHVALRAEYARYAVDERKAGMGSAAVVSVGGQFAF